MLRTSVATFALVLLACGTRVRDCRDLVYDADAGACRCPPGSAWDPAIEMCALIDAGAGDGGDAGPPDAAREATVTATVLRSGEPVLDVVVLFHAVDGAVVDERVSDAAGRAESTGAPGVAWATAVDQTGLPARLFTTPVGPGDAVTFDLLDLVNELFDAEVRLPAVDAAGAAHYDTWGWCSNHPRDDRGDVIVCSLRDVAAVTSFALDDGFAAVAWSAALEGTPTTPLVLDAWRTDFVDVPFSVANGGANTRVSLTAHDTRGFGVALAEPVDAGEGTLRVVGAHPFGSALAATAATRTAEAGGQQTRAVSIVLSSMPSSVTIDLADAPSISSVEADRSSPARPRLDWTTPTTDADYQTVQFGYGDVDWTIFVPPDARTVTLPALPPSLEGLGPAGHAPTFQIGAIRSEIVATFTSVRLRPLQGRIQPGAYATWVGSF